MLKIYNTLTRNKDEFKSINEKKVGLYVCGPTVYGYPHLGHAKSYITFDIIHRYLKYLGYDVKYVQNITDVGHLVGDVDDGEDKIEKQAKIEQTDPVAIAYNYENIYFDCMDKLNIERPTISCRATGHIIEIIEAVKTLINKGYAYVTDEGNVYYRVKKFKGYGKLSGRNIEENLSGERIEIKNDKENPEDFALWKHAEKGHIMKWPSPWGEGYPGWHIECSGIAIKYLGEHLDIHFGAEDAVFPHHTNEIAQSEAYLGHKWCNYWVHLSWLLTNNVKMSKSKGDTLTVSKLKEMGYNPLAYRYLILNSYYHKQVNFTFDGLDQAQNAYLKLINKVSNIKEEGLFSDDDFNKYDEKFKEFLSNDLNTSNALTLLYDLIKDTNVSSNTKLKLIKSWDSVLSLDLIKEYC